MLLLSWTETTFSKFSKSSTDFVFWILPAVTIEELFPNTWLHKPPAPLPSLEVTLKSPLSHALTAPYVTAGHRRLCQQLHSYLLQLATAFCSAGGQSTLLDGEEAGLSLTGAGTAASHFRELVLDIWHFAPHFSHLSFQPLQHLQVGRHAPHGLVPPLLPVFERVGWGFAKESGKSTAGESNCSQLERDGCF